MVGWAKMTNMRGGILAFVLISLLLPLGASAATLKGGESYSLKQGDTISDNLYVGASEVSIVGRVDGDLIIGGGAVTIAGDVSNDVLIAGGVVSVLKSVGGDVRIAGGDVLVTSEISGDLVILGGNVRILSGATVGRDLVIFGGRVVLEGDVRGEVSVMAEEIILDSRIQGDVYVSGKEISVGDNVVISGNLTYSGKDESVINISDGASIAGEVVFKESGGFDGEGARRAILAFFGLFVLIKLVAFITIAILSAVLFRKFSTRIAEAVISRPGKELLRGFVVFIVLPAAIILSFLTVIGGLIGVLGMIAYAALILLALIYAGIIFGVWLQKILFKNEKTIVTWKNASLGIVMLTIVTMIPFVGWIIGLFMFLVSLGSISGIIYRSFWVNRK